VAPHTVAKTVPALLRAGSPRKGKPMSQKRRFGLIGDGSALTDALRQELDLIPFSESQIEGLRGVLISRADPVVDKDALKAFFASGLSVAVSAASAEVMAALAKITGIGPLCTSPLLVYSPPADGAPGCFGLAAAIMPSDGIAAEG